MSLLRRKKRVLLLDDDPSMQRLVVKILKSEGFRVDVFLTGREAITAAERDNYDVLLLDLMMPHEGGMTVIRHFRDNNPSLLARSILFTGTSEAVIESMAADVRVVLQKPFQPDQLIQVVRDVSNQ